MTFKPIKRKKLFEEILVAIEKYIKDENLQPGDKLPSEGELSEMFQVSKTVVREAMTVLHVNGLIEKKSGTGIYLKEMKNNSVTQEIAENWIEKGDVHQVLEFRRGIEVEAAAIAAEKAAAKDLENITFAHHQLVEAHQRGEIGVKEDYNFHYAIILASQNNIYRNVFEELSQKIEEGMRISKLQSSNIPGRYEEAYQEHEEIIKGLIDGKPNDASKAMRQHLIKNETKILKPLKKE